EMTSAPNPQHSRARPTEASTPTSVTGCGRWSWALRNRRGSYMASHFRTYRVQDGKRIDGVFFMAFIHNGNYHLRHISVYQDGMIDCWGLVDFEGFRKKVRSG